MERERERHTRVEKRVVRRSEEPRPEEQSLTPETPERRPEYPPSSEARHAPPAMTEERPRVTEEIEERRVEHRPDREVVERRPVVVEYRPVVSRLLQAVNYLFALIYALLGVRFLLALLGANEAAGFVQLIYGITNPLYAPFANIVARPALNGGIFELPIVIALLGYLVLHLAIRGLVKVIAGERRTV